MSLVWNLSEASAITRTRRFGDTHTWIIPLATTDIEPCVYPDSILKSTTFCLTVSKKGLQHYSVLGRTILDHPALQHRYIFVRPDNTSTDKQAEHLGV
jgi:hypothetical protein